MIRLFVIFFSMLINIAHADCFDLQLRTSFFLPQDSTLRKVYKNGWEDGQFEISYNNDWYLTPWINLTYYETSGHSTCQKKHSRLTSRSLTFGAKKYLCCFSQEFGGGYFTPYLGIGVGVDYKTFHDKADYVRKELNRWSPTIILKSGIEIDLSCNFFLNFYLDYSYSAIFGKRCCNGIRYRSFDAGGLFAGVGIGMHW